MTQFAEINGNLYRVEKNKNWSMAGFEEKSEKVNESQIDFLKPCPFCGRNLERHTEGYGVGKVAYRHPLDISKIPCFLADSWFFGSEDEKIRWNKRVRI